MAKPILSLRRRAGFSLVELLVATAITLIGLLVITQVFAVYEGWKRTTTGVAQTQEGGLLGAFAIEQDLRNAGFGMNKTSCSKISAYNRKAVPTNDILRSASGAAVTIVPSDPEANTNAITVLYSSAPFGNVAAKLQYDMKTVSDRLYVDNGLGFFTDDLLLVSQGTSCSILQLSDLPISPDKMNPSVANVTSPGNAWELKHVAGDAAPWNPPEGEAFVYTPGANVLNLGKVVVHRYYVQDNILRMEERDPASGSLTSYDLIPGVVGLYARCLPSACNDNPTAVRFGLIVRSGNLEKEAVKQHEVKPEDITPGEIPYIEYWDGGGKFVLESDDDRRYRYRVFQTIVPLKNIIWNK